jgi:chemotaxis signal transduction protein
MGEDTYAIPVELLTEIIISQKIFPVPSTPSHVLGVINLRGNIVPIVDIRPVLSLPLQSISGQIAIVKHGNITLGIVVDNVTEVVGVPEGDVMAIPSDYGNQQKSGGSRSRFLSGIIQRKSSVSALLNIERIFEEIKLM